MSTLSVDRSALQHYGDDKGRYWSVSQVCEVVSGSCNHYSPGSAERGQDLHDIFALSVGHAAGLCDAPDVPSDYAGYYAGIQAWIAWAKPDPSGVERCMKHKIYPYAGRADFIGSIGRDFKEFGVLDLKTGTHAKWHRVQIHGYRKMLDRDARMWILYINEDGTFQHRPIAPSARDWAAFLNGLSILEWRRSCR